jgi:alkylation response protein AidB-like acyl-CoA dehydrogenase
VVANAPPHDAIDPDRGEQSVWGPCAVHQLILHDWVDPLNAFCDNRLPATEVPAKRSAMNVTFSEADLAFREEVRAIFRDEFPEDIRRKRELGVPLEREDMVRFQQWLHEHGWAGVNWPVEYGGTGWSPVQKYIFATEMADADAPAVVPFGLSMVGPIVYTFGNDEQKQRFLPDILASRVWWCQGYSEPGAGSDLASLKTRADLAGDHYIVNGTKTWTTLAQHADWIFILARTNTDVARRQEGISFLLVDMSTPGVTVRPIITIEGDLEVNEVHFEDVKVPVENLVGEEGKGWTYGKVLLQHERTNIAGVAISKFRVRKLREQTQKSVRGAVALREDRNFMRKLAAVEVDLTALEFTELRALAAVQSGKAPGPESSILKVKGTEIQQAIDTLCLEAAGYYALPFVQDQYVLDAPGDGRVGEGNETQTSLRYFNFRKASIYGGSNEIQKNIISKHVLGL